MRLFIILSSMLLIFTACKQDSHIDKEPMTFEFKFHDGTQGWTGGFADYPVGEDEDYELEFKHTPLPEPLNQEESALMLSGINMSDDLFMFVKRKVTGLEANGTYNTFFTVEFASNIPDGMIGVGGSPGESVYVKAGATALKPATEKDDMKYFRMNIDKGNQSEGGKDMIVLGDFSNDTDQEVYTLKTLQNEKAFTVTADENGEVWFLVGTDSGFESTTTIYYNKITVEME